MTLKVAPESLWATGGGTRDHAAVAYRRLLKDLTFGSSGILHNGDLAVSAKGTPDLSVNIAAGSAIILGTEATDQGSYHLVNDAVLNLLNTTTPHATQNRIDLVVACFKDADYSGAVSNPSLEWKYGAPSGSPVVPDPPANALILAQVLIRAATSSIVAGDITDKRVSVMPYRGPRGLMSYKTQTSNLANSSGALIPGLTTTAPAVTAGRIYKVSFTAAIQSNYASDANLGLFARLLQASTQIQIAYGEPSMAHTNTGDIATCTGFYVGPLTAGATIEVYAGCRRVGVTVNCNKDQDSSVSPGTLVIEDIGAAA